MDSDRIAHLRREMRKQNPPTLTVGGQYAAMYLSGRLHRLGIPNSESREAFVVSEG
jgi:hypothetical protein